jgi:formyl-CoA transferase
MRILSGVRVLELGQVLAGPFAAAILADLGADVIKVERVEGGDDARQMGAAFRHGDSLNFQVFNRNKRSVALDLKSPEGRAALQTLAADADILVHNLRPGVTEDLGIDGAAMCARHPRLIYCEISAFGHIGPKRRNPGYEPLVQAYSGLSSRNGGPDDPPLRLGASVCDQGAGMWVVIGALSMLHRRQQTGRGGVVNASLLETALVWNAQAADSFANTGTMPPRHASGHPNFVPYQAFDTATGPLLICVGNDRLFAKFAQLVGRPEWSSDPLYATNRARLINQAPLLAAIGAILVTAPRDEWLARFAAAGVPCAPINTIPEALAEAQVVALGLSQPIPGEDFHLTGLPLSFDGDRPALRSAGPRLGQHNAEVLP